MPRAPATDTRPSRSQKGEQPRGSHRCAHRPAASHEVALDTFTDSFGQPDNVAVRRAVREVHGSHLDVTFAPHSFTVCEVSLA